MCLSYVNAERNARVEDRIELYEPKAYEFDTSINMLVRSKGCLRLWKQDEQWMIWCDQCQRYESIDKQTKMDVIDSRVCPMCFREAKELKYQEEEKQHALIRLQDTYGYWVDWTIRKGHIENIKAEQVAYWEDTREYVNGIIITMNGYIGRYTRKWRYVRSYYGYWKYHGNFNDASYLALEETQDSEYGMWEYNCGTKKEYYRYITPNMQFKSDQRKFISQGLYNHNQLCYIRAFDLHNRKQVHKYAKYMKTYYCDEDEDGGWNVTTLDYLWRNKISLRDYRDYCFMCKQINRKPDKPKDFRYWHDQVTQMYDIKKNEVVNAKIESRSKALVGYEKKDTVIKPIGSYDELLAVAKTLHNCIKSYADRYADGTCDLFCMVVDGKIIGAMEIRNKKLIQARADHNHDLPAVHKKTVNTWCKRLGVAV